jgi:hypothetical protein
MDGAVAAAATDDDDVGPLPSSGCRTKERRLFVFHFAAAADAPTRCGPTNCQLYGDCCDGAP